MKERLTFQDRVITDRINVANKIKPDEWNSIIEAAKENVEKVKKKKQKKIDKGKVSKPFTKTALAIDKHISDSDRKTKVLNTLDAFISSQKDAADKLKMMNAEDSDIINKKEASKAELMEIAEDLNKLRKTGLNELITFYFLVKENTTEAEFAPIMKAFNKELSITAH